MRLILALALAACTTSKPRPLTFGGDRPVTLQPPAMVQDGKQYPLVVVLHGYGATGRIQEAYFGMNQLPAANEAFVIAPDGLTDATGMQFWNADPACCDFGHINPDDSGYLGGLIQDVIDAWPVDRGAVMVIGHSNGGYMAYRLACDHADVITNIVVLAGGAASDPTACQPSRAVEVLHLHGTADTEVPYDQVASQSVAQWAMHDGCGTTRTAGPALDLDSSLAGAETQTFTSDGCPPGVTVEFWSIQGAGHIPTFQNDFSSTIYDYFLAHRR